MPEKYSLAHMGIFAELDSLPSGPRRPLPLTQMCTMEDLGDLYCVPLSQDTVDFTEQVIEPERAYSDRLTCIYKQLLKLCHLFCFIVVPSDDKMMVLVKPLDLNARDIAGHLAEQLYKVFFEDQHPKDGSMLLDVNDVIAYDCQKKSFGRVESFLRRRRIVVYTLRSGFLFITNAQNLLASAFVPASVKGAGILSIYHDITFELWAKSMLSLFDDRSGFLKAEVALTFIDGVFTIDIMTIECTSTLACLFTHLLPPIKDKRSAPMLVTENDPIGDFKRALGQIYPESLSRLAITKSNPQIDLLCDENLMSMGV